MFDSHLSAAIYARLLFGYHTLYADWERRQARWLGGDLRQSGWHYRSRLPAIESDLRALGECAPGGTPGDLATVPDLPGAPIAAPAWGSLYVVEGSALGGQVIARRLAAGMPGHAHLFFNMGHGHGQPTWRDFQVLLDTQLGSPAARRAIALQARATFGQFQQMLQKVLD